MYSVLIVDDEEPVLESYSFMLESGVPGFSLVGKARSGYEAIKLIYELRPDVVFMDINMPGLDGLDTIEEVHGKVPDTVFVLSTAYERFDLARRAIPLGVHDYLVKPVTKKMFTETLAAIAMKLDQRPRERDSGDGDALEDDFLKRGIWRPLDEARWTRLRDALSLGSDSGTVAFVGIDPEGGDFFPDLNARISLSRRFLFANHLGLGMYFFPGADDFGPIGELLDEALKAVVPPAVASFSGVGQTRPWGDFRRSCAEALEDINRKKNSGEVRIRERMRIIALRRKNGLAEYPEILALFASYRDEVVAAYGVPVAKVKLATLFTLLVDDVLSCFKTHSEEVPPFDPIEELCPLDDVPSIVTWSEQAFERVYALARQKRTGEFPVPLVKAIAFIGESYSRQIQLSDAAEAANVSSAYLSRLFSEHTGSSFVDYLTALRIERAERLIRENRLSIKEVAFATGYQDPNYFSKLFRKIVGVSPTMYAERIRDGEGA
ncbi:MAG TPA: helix-turn-helix domain-containing protein [Treponemataceae bacterium]|nr:helix-turn-helix domain-containing protein [Treponemataceae bacterium]HPS42853.1 helix-turn-helix domain-containing protein [Treponemataceae bacterium]